MWSELVLVYVTCTLVGALDNTYKWTLMPDVSGAPSPRFDFSYGYSQVTSRFYVFGGQAKDGILGDFYSFSTAANNTWNVLPNGPSPRRDAAGALCSGKFYVLGGKNETDILDDMWVFDEGSNQWSMLGRYSTMQLTAGSLSCGAKTALVYSGGLSPYNTYPSVTYIYDINSNTWTPTAKVGPGGRAWAPLVSVASHSQSVVFGGYNGSFPQYNDLWIFNNAGSQWQNIPNRGQWPLGRSGHVLAYDQGSDSVVLFGGEDDKNATMNDLWYFSLQSKTWTLVVLQEQPGSRLGAGVAVANGFILVFGGVTGLTSNDKVLNEMWMLQSAGYSMSVGLLCITSLLFSLLFV